MGKFASSDKMPQSTVGEQCELRIKIPSWDEVKQNGKNNLIISRWTRMVYNGAANSKIQMQKATNELKKTNSTEMEHDKCHPLSCSQSPFSHNKCQPNENPPSVQKKWNNLQRINSLNMTYGINFILFYIFIVFTLCIWFGVIFRFLTFTLPYPSYYKHFMHNCL